MQAENEQLETLKDIRQMMSKSSRFISLSGWSGVSAGICALIGAWLAHQKIRDYRPGNSDAITEDASANGYAFRDGYQSLATDLIYIAIGTFIAAFILAFLFTYLRSRKTGVAIWGYTSRKLMINVVVPMVAGGFLILRLLQLNAFGVIAPACLIFYGLALINASKYTLPEIRYLGYSQLVLGIINLWMPGHGLLFWAAGFGLLHIIYGIVMWNKYERNQ